METPEEVKEPLFQEKSTSFTGQRDINSWPLILIVIGIYFLLRNFNIINDRIINALFSAWPLFLVWLGIHLGTKSMPRLRMLGSVAVISILVFIILQNSGANLPYIR
jgi:Domain of unknown function (DUF5668)